MFMKLRTFSLLSLLSFFIVSTSQFAQGQPSKSREDEEELKKTLYAFAKAYSSLPKTKKRDEVLKHVADNLTSTNITARVNGSITTDNGTFGMFAAYLNKVSRTENFGIVYEVKDIIKTQIRGNNAVMVYEVYYEFTKDGTVWSKGTETVSMLFHKYGEVWKIQHFTFFNIEDQKFRGACLCEVFSAPTGDYVAKTTVPAGKSYITSLTNYIFKGAPELDKQVIVDNYKFTWKANGELIAESVAPEGVTLTNKALGNASTKDEVVVLILQEFLFKNNCSKLVKKGR